MQFTIDRVDEAIFYYMKDYQSVLVDVNDIYNGVKQLCLDDHRAVSREIFIEGLNKALKHFSSLELYESKHDKYLYFYVEGKSDHHFIKTFEFDEKVDPLSELKKNLEKTITLSELKNNSLARELEEKTIMVMNLKDKLDESQAENGRFGDKIEELIRNNMRHNLPMSQGNMVYYNYFIISFVMFILGVFFR